MRTLVELAEELGTGRLRATQLIDASLARIADARGEGARTFLKVFERSARAEAEAVDRLRARGADLPRFAGIPLSVKDLFDTAGDVTTAGTTVLRDRPAASADAPAVARLRAAGFILMGRTNMTELAYSGLGINPHYGTPLNAFDRSAGRIPGGSSSGAAVSVTDQMAAAALGTDTGGSCRIPAAFCGIVGFKPTAARVPRTGVLALSTTLDSVGPLAVSVGCCALLDAILAQEDVTVPAATPVRGLRLLVPTTYVLDDLEAPVARAFERSLSRLSAAGALIVQEPIPSFSELPRINAKGGFSAAESFATFRELLETRFAEFDPRVATRILKGREQNAADYLQLKSERQAFAAELHRRLAAVDALALPTVPIIAPRLDALIEEERYFRANALALRNPAIANFMDGCSISLPMHEAGEAPMGFMLIAGRGSDRRLFALARAIEEHLAA